MKRSLLKISEILVRDSLFNYQGYVFRQKRPDDFLKRLLIRYPEALPLVVYTDRTGRYHLVDGFRRIALLSEGKQEVINALVFPSDTPIEDMIVLRADQHWVEISSTGANRLGFLALALRASVDREWVLKRLCRQLMLRSSEDTLQMAEKLTTLSMNLREFFHKKSYSAKQLENILRYPSELLELVGGWLGSLQLTASVFEEILEALYDHLRAKEMEVSELKKQPEIEEIMQGKNPNENTRRLRELLNHLRRPILAEKNNRIQELVEMAGLPPEIRLSWDRSLENHQVNISVNIKRQEDVKHLLEHLNKQKVQDCIKGVLKEL